MAMKQLYTVPFQRNSDVVKEARCQYVEVGNITTEYCNALSYNAVRVNWGHISLSFCLFYLENKGA